LANFGEVVTNIKEVLFEDGNANNTTDSGMNRMGNYNVKIKLNRDVPELLTFLGKRIKIVYPGITRLCSNCFGPHSKTKCQSKKMSWPDYIAWLRMSYPEIAPKLIDRPSY
jgi:hypothetical protein